MLKVKTKVGNSHIEGLGLFAAERIPKGTMVWELDSGDCVVASKEEIPPELFKYCFLEDDGWVIPSDDSRYINHSFEPNTGLHRPDGSPTFACQDIEVGEEITEDYRETGCCAWGEFSLDD